MSDAFQRGAIQGFAQEGAPASTPASGAFQDTAFVNAAFDVAVAPPAGFTLPIAAGTYSMSGATVSLLHKQTLPLASSTYTLTGAAVTTLRSRRTIANSGTYSLTGAAVTFPRSRRTIANSGTYSLSGSTVALKHGWKTTLLSGSYALTGAAINTLRGRRNTLVAGSYALTGSTVALNRVRKITTLNSTYALTGASLAFQRGTRFPIGAGSYSIVPGYFDAIKAGVRTVVGTHGDYLIVGAQLSPTKTTSLFLNNANYIITGSTVGTIAFMTAFRSAAFLATAFQTVGQNQDIVTNAGSYTLTGAPIGMAWDTSRFIMPGGAYALTGAAIQPEHGYKPQMGNGSYSITGSVVNLRKPKRIGYLWVYTGSEWQEKPLKLWNGSAWVTKKVKFYDGIWHLA